MSNGPHAIILPDQRLQSVNNAPNSPPLKGIGFSGCSKLRAEIRSAVTQDVAWEKNFYPSSKLRQLITRDRVLEALQCSCSFCSRRIEFQTPQNIAKCCEDILTTRHVLCFNGNDALNLFALLIVIECPQLIIPFLKVLQSGNAPRTLEDLSPDFLRNRVWKRFDEKCPDESVFLAKEFSWQKYKFAVGSMTNAYEVFDRRVILPYVNERSIDEGAFGKVYSFEIPEEYRRRLEPTDVHKFARKELRFSIQHRFEAEKANLEFIRHLADPHLIAIIKAYKHGEHFNLVFPCARTNLDSYLRDPQFQTPEMFNDRIEFHPFWSQMLGITGALRKIHSCTIPGEERDHELYGYHFDIKPANILVENSGKFVITDFGQANFKQRKGTSRVTGMGGTEAYAPPEIEQRNVKPNRKYDVWSLGCVFLEVCTFATLRYEGVKRLDELKRSKSADHRREYECFFEASLNPESYQLKSTLRRWMHDLPQSASIQDEKGRVFLCKILELMAKMLQVTADERSSSEEVYQELSEIVRPYRSSVQTLRTISSQSIVPLDEMELGSTIMSEISPLICSVQGQHFESPVRIAESSKGFLTIMTTQNDEPQTWALGPRTSSALIPQYALHDETHHEYSGSHLVITSTSATTSMSPSTSRHRVSETALPMKFFFFNVRSSVLMQSVLLGQEVKRSLNLNGLQVEVSFLQRSKRKVQHKSSLVSENLGKPSMIQLWQQQSQHSRQNRTSVNSQGPVPRSNQLTLGGPASRRIVIFCAQMILTVVFTKLFRLTAPDAHGRSLVLHIVPMDKSVRSTFKVSTLALTSPIISAASDGVAGAESALNLPSFPLDRATLEKHEEEGSFECQSLALTFQYEDDMRAFFETYRSMKEAWSAEVYEIKNAKGLMGEVLGWAPN